MNLINKINNDKKFMSVAGSILTHKEYVKLKNIYHHGSTRYNHSVKVAYTAYKLSNVFGCDSKSAIIGGALHDFFLERDDENIAKYTKMLINHPTIAKENAIKYFGINEKEQNIIEAHMFPTSTVVPKYKESWIVVAADKLVSMIEGATVAKSRVVVWMLFLINFIK